MRSSEFPHKKPSPNSIIESISSRWRGFPNITTLGSYDYLSQIIRLNSLDKRDIDDLRLKGEPALKKKVLPLMEHEGTHWLDHLTTVWGQSSLIDIYNAFHARIKNEEYSFWRIAKLKSSLKRIHYADYYSTVAEAGKRPWDRQPWRQAMSVGFEFSPDGKTNKLRPIVFLRFSTYEGQLVARVPLSIASLLETIATASELDIEMKLADELPKDESIVEKKLIEKKYTDLLFNGQLCVYSACAHLLANITGIFDFVTAYQRAARLALLCLNLPRKALDRIVLFSQTFGGISGIASYFKKNHDRAIAFYVLAQHAPSTSSLGHEEWLDSLLKSSGIGTFEQIQHDGDEELAAQKDIIDGPEYTRLKNLLLIGTRLRGNRSRDNIGFFNTLAKSEKGCDSSSDSPIAPTILLGDDHVITMRYPPVSINHLLSESLVPWIYRVWEYDSLLDEFLHACIA